MLLSVLTNPSSFNFYKYWIVDFICQVESFNPHTQVMVRKIDQTNTFPKFKGNWEPQTNLGPKLANLLQLNLG